MRSLFEAGPSCSGRGEQAASRARPGPVLIPAVFTLAATPTLPAGLRAPAETSRTSSETPISSMKSSSRSSSYSRETVLHEEEIHPVTRSRRSSASSESTATEEPGTEEPGTVESGTEESVTVEIVDHGAGDSVDQGTGDKLRRESEVGRLRSVFEALIQNQRQTSSPPAWRSSSLQLQPRTEVDEDIEDREHARNGEIVSQASLGDEEMITHGDDIRENSEEGDAEYPASLPPPPQFRDSPPLTPAPPPRSSPAPARQTVQLLATSPPVKVQNRASHEGLYEGS